MPTDRTNGSSNTQRKKCRDGLRPAPLERLASNPVFAISINIPSPHAHDLCWRTGMMDRWECAAFAD
ncbi:MAG: hypothetical protein KA803_07330 [Rhodoferax sp.]|nr:hypothetical protein [Rhodoferax sp.]